MVTFDVIVVVMVVVVVASVSFLATARCGGRGGAGTKCPSSSTSDEPPVSSTAKCPLRAVAM